MESTINRPLGLKGSDYHRVVQGAAPEGATTFLRFLRLAAPWGAPHHALFETKGQNRFRTLQYGKSQNPRWTRSNKTKEEKQTKMNTRAHFAPELCTFALLLVSVWMRAWVKQDLFLPCLVVVVRLSSKCGPLHVERVVCRWHYFNKDPNLTR